MPVTNHQTIACDIDLKHGWIGLVRARQRIEDDLSTNWELISVETLIEYDFEGNYVLSEKSDFSHVLWRADVFNIILVREWAKRSYEIEAPTVVVEYDRNRVHYKGARKLANIQNAHFMGAFLYAIEVGGVFNWSVITPNQVRSVMKTKSKTWEVFSSQTGVQLLDLEKLPTPDRHGDMLDAVALAFYRFQSPAKWRKDE